MTALVEHSSADGVHRITLNHPPLNVLTSPMLDALTAAVHEVSDARMVILSASGRAFCAGADVGEHTPEKVAPMLARFHAACRALISLDVPTIAAVQGAALGGGCELVALCDFVVAARSATFGQPEIRLASFPPVATAALASVIGQRRAMSLILLGDVIPAEAAREAGLVTTVVEDGQVEEAASQLAARMAQLSGPALRVAKRAGMHIFRRAFEETLANAEHLYLDELIETEDAREGITAFLEKRAPVWHHR